MMSRDRRYMLEIDHIWRGTLIPEVAGVKYGCPCCRCLTLHSRGTWEICPVCMWEDDGQDDSHADEVWGGPNGALSLSAARRNYAALGASDARHVTSARPPTEDERPEPVVLPLRPRAPRAQ